MTPVVRHLVFYTCMAWGRGVTERNPRTAERFADPADMISNGSWIASSEWRATITRSIITKTVYVINLHTVVKQWLRHTVSYYICMYILLLYLRVRGGAASSSVRRDVIAVAAAAAAAAVLDIANLGGRSGPAQRIAWPHRGTYLFTAAVEGLP